MPVTHRLMPLVLVALLGAFLGCGDPRRTAIKPEPTSAGEAEGRVGPKEADKKPAKKPGKVLPKKKAPAELDINDLNLEVVALQVLTDLQVTPAQQKALADLAEKTAQKPGPRKVVKVSAKYRKTLTALRNALAADDEERIEELLVAVEELREKEKPDFDDIDITDAARKHAPALLKRFTARQVLGYAAGVGDFPDPGERLLEALGRSRELMGKTWFELRDGVAEEIGWLVAGLDTKAEQKVRTAVLALLNKTNRLDEKDYTAQKAALEKEARDITGTVEPTQVIKHYMERALAELLSNPRLGPALALRRKKAT